jgi:molybdenum cofactor synthesis domain-containing protein
MPEVRVGVVTCSDTCAAGGREDASGDAIVETCEARGWTVIERVVCADDLDTIAAAIVRFADEQRADLVLTTGGTGLGPRDVTPEATRAACPRDVPGIAEAIRAESLRVTKRAMLSRAVAGQRGKTLVVNMPGSVKAVRETLGVFLDQVEHAVEMMAGGGHD